MGSSYRGLDQRGVSSLVCAGGVERMIFRKSRRAFLLGGFVIVRSLYLFVVPKDLYITH